MVCTAEVKGAQSFQPAKLNYYDDINYTPHAYNSTLNSIAKNQLKEAMIQMARCK